MVYRKRKYPKEKIEHHDADSKRLRQISMQKIQEKKRQKEESNTDAKPRGLSSAYN